VSSLCRNDDYLREILLVDDGSTDDTESAFLQFEVECNKLKLHTKVNGGCASARMFGFRASVGEYVAFVDADDWVEAEFLKELRSACETLNTPVALCFYRTFYEEQGTYCESFPLSFLKGDSVSKTRLVIPAREMLLWKPTIWAAIYKRDFLVEKRIEFPEHIKLFDDLAFHAQVVFSGANVAVVPKHLYNYRLQRPGQDVSNRGEKLFVHFNIFDYLDMKLSSEARNSMDYFLLKYQTHRWTQGIIEERLKKAYQARAAADLFRGRSVKYAMRGISELSKIRRRYGRDALALFGRYQLKERWNGADPAQKM
jgi:glycosyltransferase involved in cell wall biosynthesis